jgi:hypothetical protein
MGHPIGKVAYALQEMTANGAVLKTSIAVGFDT